MAAETMPGGEWRAKRNAGLGRAHLNFHRRVAKAAKGTQRISKKFEHDGMIARPQRHHFHSSLRSLCGLGGFAVNPGSFTAAEPSGTIAFKTPDLLIR
jgi:hypothetical protein